MLFVLREDQEKKYEVYDSYTGETVDTLDTRAEAKTASRGKHQLRIRTHVVTKS